MDRSKLFDRVRSDWRIGEGTCSIFEEAYTDNELYELIDELIKDYPHDSMEDHIKRLIQWDKDHWDRTFG